jgi:H+-transporting ATPase
LGLAELQTLVFVWVVFAGGQAVLYLTRTRGYFWQPPYPGHWVLLTTLLDIVVVSLLAAEGWLMAPISMALIGGAFGLALAFLVVADLIKVVVMRTAV